ncbi:thiamine-phosphate kinase, partial [Cognatilysobacter lacus]
RLAGVASACIDVSDGLLADLGHVLRASGVGARVDVDRLPASAELLDTLDVEQRRSAQASGGDDYELCFTAQHGSAERVREIAAAADVAVTRVGVVEAGAGVLVVDGDGRKWVAGRAGYQHFGVDGSRHELS